jgi:hypothetical protein
MKSNAVTVVFEFTDAHISIIDDDSYINDIEMRCINLCEVFDFEYKLIQKNLDHAPHLVFQVSFINNILNRQHYMNVLAAFAQEFQINIANAREEYID